MLTTLANFQFIRNHSPSSTVKIKRHKKKMITLLASHHMRQIKIGTNEIVAS